MKECSNRTFMELKCWYRVDSEQWPYGSNRTFMELKYMSNAGNRLHSAVLIVPLWN